jgi:hypothetical protein
MNKVLSSATVAAQVALAGLFAWALTNSIPCGILGGALAFLCDYFKSLDQSAVWGPWDYGFNIVFTAGFLTYVVLSVINHWAQATQAYAIIGGAAWGIIVVAILQNVFSRIKLRAKSERSETSS